MIKGGWPMDSKPRLRISRREGFNAAHQLYDPARSDEENRRLYGKCVNLHGHNYVVEVVVTGEIDPASGYVMDLKQLSDVMVSQIIEQVDHRNLNTDIPWLRDRIPTAENLAVAFWDRLRPHLGIHGLRLDVVEIASGTVRLRLHGSGAATIKAPLLWTLPGEIEDAVVEAAPDVEKILIDGLVPQEAAAAVRAAE